ncbi:hypothetical protein K2Z84_21510 [Candidatus Binatia bacterium]|nr:hypothetical protein [Candidatus Binatia bacterium]
MKVRVTQEHIVAGKARSPGSCPIALALVGARPDRKWLVGERNVTVYENHAPIAEVLLPRAASNFVREFDLGVPVEPFEFELEVLP